MPKVIISGAGPVGALNACFFAQKGWNVEVYEFRPDIRTTERVQGKSINLALSYRGECALEAVGLKDYILSQGIPMYARLIHDQDGKTIHTQPYGRPGERIVSINRKQLNEVMVAQAERFTNVKFFFKHTVMNVDPKKGIVTVENNGIVTEVQGDLILACDGAHSAVRRSMMAYPLFRYSQEYITHGFIELSILPKNDDYALEPEGFHLWPRGDFTLIALANTDKSFTVNIFAPFDIFRNELSNRDSALRFFKKYFPDAYELMGEDHVADTFETLKPRGFVSIKCNPHSFDGKVLLMGDAAHAMGPFYGQGLNAGFEDCLVFSETLEEFNNDITKALDAYSVRRYADAHSINDLSLYNYDELKDLVNRVTYKARKAVDLFLNQCFPNSWVPLYSMVTFTRIPYHKVMERRHEQDQTVNRILMFTGLILLSTFGIAAWIS
ncbi:hypothetical protein FO519_008620 [Halicephalobus sp. NKZ332]|nr:hypothetical protein FO519_008620 [Halicephalobus sp. NKZ332]